MKLAITVSLGNYQSIKIETNDHPDLKAAINELNDYASLLNISELTEYLEMYLNIDIMDLSD